MKNHLAAQIIRQEHAALDAMLRSILMLIEQHRRENSLPDFAALRAMVFHVDEFPEQRHHRQEYVAFDQLHTAMEEREILPLAERVLTESDWADLDEGFTQNRDPLTGHAPGPDYQALVTRIVGIVPAPIGLGSARPTPAEAAFP